MSQASSMPSFKAQLFMVVFVLLACAFPLSGQTDRYSEDEFGPVVRAYLGYLRNEQEVVDDRVSRREISATYYRRNSNRIRALRQIAVRLARDAGPFAERTAMRDVRVAVIDSGFNPDAEPASIM